MNHRPKRLRRVDAAVVRSAVIAIVVSAAIGCGADVSHENLDNWRSTQKGPSKLLAALKSSDHDADLRAHAAHSLLVIDQFAKVKGVLEEMSPADRAPIIEKLVPRLWKTARIETEKKQPTALQAGSKDALFEIRQYASNATRKMIDERIVEWFTDGYYEGRAESGRISGRMAVHAIGAPAGAKLVEAAQSIVAHPPDEQGRRLKVGNELLLGLALSGAPEAIGFLLRLVTVKRKDDTLAGRAMGALSKAFVEPVSGLTPVDPQALKEHVKLLDEIRHSPNASGVMKNDVIDLLALTGMPECLEPFVDMISDKSEMQYLYIGVQQGLRCGGVDAIIPVLEAIPTNRSFERGILSKYAWEEILNITARKQVAERLRTLLASRSWVARVSAVEILGSLGLAESAAKDARKIRQLRGDKKILKQWWGKRKEGKVASKRPDPTLGHVAGQVAKRLQELAKSTQTK